ncbi:OmpP1/FadL family transporter [Psychroserpens sp.]|uniref:OmpP1/FadL family transporter n=1 Tax=Psychroserpens sp. TaxID=2020870 RepID=UPI001B07993A|nr:outer membrane protein transport protein [Psychroserpens sp.]MBO6607672.1 outer membrane protein transport protein [Psychroserpens sp.]MBO6655016.1 outer membrane protein transport protein [Psychroserpens sp.]MBO6683179.1 outer membrane protein transport protein [Psychroserpens sp.]MBO6749642.1 outer membrane protein transport protein [Psychroserpens sp.]MBO6916566.1 outer membrane protein transport protein [Psychroserpens sp.]
MKKLAILVMGVLAMTSVNAQDISDILRYSQDEVQGTARFRALSGAFGALGGDMSAVSINPAGSAVFNESHASISLSSLNLDNDISFFNGRSATSDSRFDVNQAGAAFVFANRDDSSSWRKFVLSIAYDKTANHDDQWFANGRNNNSIDSYFLAYAQGLRLDEIEALPGESLGQAYAEIGSFFGFANQQAFLGYESFILEPDEFTDGNTLYTSNIAPGTFDQAYSYVATGLNGKFSFNLAAQYEDKLYVGLNLNGHFINYERFTAFDEFNNNVGSLVTDVRFDNSLFTTGNGFSFQLGAILKVTKELRAGLSYQSPTWFTIFEETTQSIGTFVEDSVNGDFSVVINPNIVNVFPEYRLRTPGKITGSLAYVFDRGLFSFDYTRRDYTNMELRPTSDPFFASQNQTMSNIFKAANTYRLGGEYKYKQFSFRGGYRFEESPYQDDNFYGDLTGYSVGLGYNFGTTRIDLTYDAAERTVNNQLFSVGLTDAATVDTTNSNITLTVGFSL